MSEPLLKRVGPEDLAALSAFEFDNRAFFESRINARPASFYAGGGVAHARCCATTAFSSSATHGAASS